MKDQASAHARALGMSDAEYYRHCIRTQLGFYRDLAAIPVEDATIDQLLRRAGYGDAEAQMEMGRRRQALAVAEPNPILQRLLLMSAATFTLMAAQHGSGEASRMLGAVQLQAALLHREDVAEGRIPEGCDIDALEIHGLAYLDLAADRGDVPAAEGIHDIADGLAPHVVTGAARLREAWRAQA